ncbi:hypothetical protein ACUH89_08035 [Dermabacteraceae bacterium P13264]
MTLKKLLPLAVTAFLLFAASCGTAAPSQEENAYVPDSAAGSSVKAGSGSQQRSEQGVSPTTTVPAGTSLVDRTAEGAAAASSEAEAGKETGAQGGGDIVQAAQAREFSHLFWSDFYARAGAGDRNAAERFFAPGCVKCREFSARLFALGTVFPPGSQIALRFADGPVHQLPGNTYRVEGKSVLSVSGSQLLFGYVLNVSPTADGWQVNDMTVWEEN